MFCSVVITHECGVLIRQGEVVLVLSKEFFAEHYFSRKSFVLCQEGISNETVPDKITFHCLIRKFHETDNAFHQKRNHNPTVLRDDMLEDVMLSLLQSPLKSLKKLPRSKNMSLGSAHK
jgi:hypothetical protein